MKSKDVVMGLAVIVVLVVSVLIIKNKKNSINIPTPTPTIEQKIEERFGGLAVPVDVEKAELKDVSGGDGFGIATRTEVLADLPELTGAKVYQVWLEKDTKKILLGSMRIAKGGYLLEYSSSKFPGYNKVLITLDGNSILEGSF